jgi:hypothetical protein
MVWSRLGVYSSNWQPVRIKGLGLTGRVLHIEKATEVVFLGADEEKFYLLWYTARNGVRAYSLPKFKG